MAYQDFRQFLDALRQAGELIDIDRPIALSDVGKALKQSYACEGPALMFKQNGTDVPLVAGIYSTRRKALIALQAEETSVADKLQHALNNPIAATLVSGSAPCQEEVLTGAAIDINRFPVPQYSPKDGGRYITPGIVVSKDPETGVPDIGHYRFLVLSGDTLSYDAQPFHRFGKNISKCQRMGVVPRAAVVIGVDPVLAYTCQMQVPDTTDDWQIAGAIRGAPVELVKCKTIDLEVPATAEVVIEFEIDLNRLVSEGPLGEYTGYYTPAVKAPVARILAVTHRRKPIFQGLLTGKPITENHILKQIPFEASFLNMLRRQFPTVERVSVRASAGVSFYVVVAMRPRFAGEARQVILSAMSSNIRPKWIVVVDPDIDVHSSGEVEWAMAFRVLPQRDVFVMEQLPSGPADPATITLSDDGERISAALALSSAVGIDATLPVGTQFSEVADVPGWREFSLPELQAYLRK
ncbi:MAG: UbiD family decarboxylase [Hyphomicrobiales bacterium]|nr:UbiD family decarboxylase [Hyphomicrobiales bacterium]